MSVIASKATVAWSDRHGGRIGIITFDDEQRSSAGTVRRDRLATNPVA